MTEQNPCPTCGTVRPGPALCDQDRINERIARAMLDAGRASRSPSLGPVPDVIWRSARAEMLVYLAKARELLSTEAAKPREELATANKRIAELESEVASQKQARERDASMAWPGIQKCRTKLTAHLRDSGWIKEGIETPEDAILTEVYGLRERIAELEATNTQLRQRDENLQREAENNHDALELEREARAELKVDLEEAEIALACYGRGEKPTIIVEPLSETEIFELAQEWRRSKYCNAEHLAKSAAAAQRAKVKVAQPVTDEEFGKLVEDWRNTPSDPSEETAIGQLFRMLRSRFAGRAIGWETKAEQANVEVFELKRQLVVARDGCESLRASRDTVHAEIKQIKAQFAANPAIPSEPTEQDIEALENAVMLGGVRFAGRGHEDMRAAFAWFRNRYSAAPALPTEAELVVSIEMGRADWLRNHGADIEESGYQARAVREFLKSKPAQTVTISQAIDVITRELSTDQAYRFAWISNIAMPVQDKWALWSEQHPGTVPISADVNVIANQGAEWFLDVLCKTGKRADETKEAQAERPAEPAPAQRPFMPSAETVEKARGVLSDPPQAVTTLGKFAMALARDLAQAAEKGGGNV
jgi:hypothetical protein